jgi:hypothetical protein
MYVTAFIDQTRRGEARIVELRVGFGAPTAGDLKALVPEALQAVEKAGGAGVAATGFRRVPLREIALYAKEQALWISPGEDEYEGELPPDLVPSGTQRWLRAARVFAQARADLDRQPLVRVAEALRITYPAAQNLIKRARTADPPLLDREGALTKHAKDLINSMGEE